MQLDPAEERLVRFPVKRVRLVDDPDRFDGVLADQQHILRPVFDDAVRAGPDRRQVRGRVLGVGTVVLDEDVARDDHPLHPDERQ